MDLAAWGVDPGYWDIAGHWHEVTPETTTAVAEAMGVGKSAPSDSQPPVGPPLWFVRAGQVEFLHRPCELMLEDGTTLHGVDALPPDLPPGYHGLQPDDGGPATTLVVSPGRCHLPAELKAWGFALQLYAARSRQSWGIGDLADLRFLGEWSGGLGAKLIGVNPLHAPGPALPQEPSPYYPSSRRFRSPLYLRVEEVHGAGEVADELDGLAITAKTLNHERIIDRDRVWQLKRRALERCFAAFGKAGSEVEAFDAYRKTGGSSLELFTQFAAIAEVHGNSWHDWPAVLRRPDSPSVERFGEERAERCSFHAWLQWQLDLQLAAAAGTRLVADLAVGFDPSGADAWAWQDQLALDVEVGAPPDEFNPSGQAWGLPPFIPWKLRADGYRPFIETLRSSFRHAGGLRIDHVMGLFRLYWIPIALEAIQGAYVRYPASELLDILALESHRANAFVVGEDLGTVEGVVRSTLAERRVLTYRLVWFESGMPENYPSDSLAALNTHDLPTLAGVWTGSDLAARRKAGIDVNADAEVELHDRLVRASGAGADDSLSDVVTGAFKALAATPSRVVMATLDDVLGVEERPNIPGATAQQWANWSLALPVPIEELETHEGAKAVAETLSAGR